MNAYGLLVIAILVEVAGTTLLPRTEGFRNLPWVSVVLLCYAFAFFLMARIVETIPVYVAYAVWAGMGTALVALVGITLRDEPSSAPRIAGVVLIVVGVVLVNWAIPDR